MKAVSRAFHGHPKIVSGIILIGLALSMAAANDFIRNTYLPEIQRALEAKIEFEIDKADSRFDKRKYARAKDGYEYVLGAFGEHLSVGVRGRITDRIGLCHYGIGTRGGPPDRFDRAIEKFNEALALLTREAFPTAYAATQNHLGNAFRALSQAKDENGIMEEAVRAYKRALEINTAQTDSVARATTLNLLGNAYRDVYRSEPDHDTMNTAIRYYEAAEAMLSLEDAPEISARVQRDFGRAYLLRARNSYFRKYTLEGLAKIESALEVFTPESYPREYGWTQKYLGDAYIQLTRTKPRRRADRALHAQRVYRYKLKAQEAYRFAQNFGVRDAVALLNPGLKRARTQGSEQDKK